MTNTKEIIAEYLINNSNASAQEIADNCHVSKSTAYKYLRDLNAETPAEKGDSDTVTTTKVKTYTTKTQRGYSQKQMQFVYSHCKNHDLYIAKPVLEKMYSWADKFNFIEPDPVAEDLRNAACKLVKCVSMGKYDIAQSKARYIESVLKNKAA